MRLTPFLIFLPRQPPLHRPLRGAYARFSSRLSSSSSLSSSVLHLLARPSLSNNVPPCFDDELVDSSHYQQQQKQQQQKQRQRHHWRSSFRSTVTVAMSSNAFGSTAGEARLTDSAARSTAVTASSCPHQGCPHGAHARALHGEGRPQVPSSGFSASLARGISPRLSSITLIGPVTRLMDG